MMTMLPLLPTGKTKSFGAFKGFIKIDIAYKAGSAVNLREVRWQK